MSSKIDTKDNNLNKQNEKLHRKKSSKKSDKLSEAEKTILIHELEVHQLELAMQNEELNLTKENLEIAVEKYTELYDSAPTGYMSLAHDSTIIELNLGASKMLGLERSILTGKRLVNFINPGSNEAFATFLSEIFKNVSQESCELVLKTATALTVYIVGHLSKNGDHCDLNMINVTERKKAEERQKELVTALTLANNRIASQIEEKKLHEAELIKANNELEHSLLLNDEKNRFISILAHDLRSPFSVILGYSELLSEKIHELNENEIEKLIKEIESSTKNTFSLLEDLLKWARLQTGKVPFKPLKFRFAEICYEEINYIRSAAESKNISIDIVISPDIEIFADIDMIKAVLRNLLSNAAKFSKSDGTIKINAEQTESNLVFSISDNGVGIKSEDLAKIFDLDHFQTKAGTSGEKGTGLGLFLSKGFIEKNGGKLWVESVLGKGTIFYFNLPAKSGQTAKPEPLTDSPETKSKKLKILIVDDNDSLRMILGEIVKQYSKEILFAGNGVEAVSIMRNNPDTDLILMDFFMPEMNGNEAIKQIRLFNDNVIIFVETADTLSDVKAEFHGAGISDFYPKPYSKKYFTQLLIKHFGKEG